jgi:hypothetical protein
MRIFHNWKPAAAGLNPGKQEETRNVADVAISANPAFFCAAGSSPLREERGSPPRPT